MAREKIKLTSYDELLGVQKDGTIEVNLTELHEFKNHPFKVIDDEKMQELAESIKANGVLSPALVRKRSEGGYELISGHRRKRACEMAGLSKMPVIVKELSDDEATIIMVDANIQREEILPSEKAFAFKMKMEAMSHQGVSNGKITADEIGADNGVSGRQVKRYIRLTMLIPELLQLVDEKKLPFVVGVEISYLDEEFQEVIYKNLMEGKKVGKNEIHSLRQNEELEEGELTIYDIEGLLFPEKAKKKISNVTLNQRKLAKYFTPDYEVEQIEEIILSLLEKWNEEQRKKEASD
ncbi:MAG: ParB/RepB/Spo0J family partition protein [Eubacterium sp.]|nr:ParB/RepB/Spo0J family partition protein [Eubacterium sp.]